MPDPPIDLAGLDAGAEDLLAAVLETLAQPVWVVDAGGVIRFANPPAIAALGYDRAEALLGRPSHETIHHERPDGDPYPAAECRLLLPLETGETVSSDLDWLVRGDGSMLPVAAVSAPVELEDGRGAVIAFTGIEDRLRAEHDRDAALVAQLGSLRRVAALVAGGAPSAEVFAAIAREVAGVLGLDLVAMWRHERDETATVLAARGDRVHPLRPGTRWSIDGPVLAREVRARRRAVRIEDFEQVSGTIATALREAGIRSAAGAPIVVDRDIWGVMATYGWGPEPLPDRIEDRLAEFTALMATAVSNTASRDELERLADEQASLRRVATLVAQAAPPAELLAAATREVGRLLGAGAVRIERDGGEAVAAWSAAGDDAPGPEPESAGAPIVVDRRPWGVMTAFSPQDRRLPADAGARLGAFAELVATAISNREARAEVARLAEEQAALRRVATLVAEGVPPAELFAAVAAEVGRLLGADLAGMIRYLAAGTIAAVATWAAEGEHPEVPGPVSLEGDRLATAIRRTGQPIREDDWAGVEGPIAAFVRERLGVRSSVGSPIVVEGRVWGALFVHSKTERPLPAGTESRMARFTELVNTAMSNAQARADVRRLAEEQAALRRVATLVAQATPAMEVFAAVAAEIGRLLPVEDTAMLRYEDDGTATVLASWGRRRAGPVGSQVPVAGQNVTALVRRTGRPARIDDDAAAAVQSAVGCPIAVEGRVWGVMVAAQGVADPLPADTESRVAQFTELIGTAIANAQARTDLAASRARIVAAADDERRRVVRDLHGGAQQRLVQTIVTLQVARQEVAPAHEAAGDLVTEALAQAERATVELRELAHGLLPAVLIHGGLRAGVRELASRMPVPVEVAVAADRLPPAVEATAYFVVAESLTNVAKHARATHASVRVEVDDGTLRITVSDDGAGGARVDGTGLVGLADRLAVWEGRLCVESPPGGGTLVAADIPLGTRA